MLNNIINYNKNNEFIIPKTLLVVKKDQSEFFLISYL